MVVLIKIGIAKGASTGPYEMLYVQCCCKQFPVRGKWRPPPHPHNRISQLLNIDLAQQGLGLDLK